MVKKSAEVRLKTFPEACEIYNVVASYSRKPDDIMKKTIILLTGFLLTGIAHVINGQTDVDEKEMVGFACSFSGMPSKPVIKVTELLEKKNYPQISKLFSSRNPAEQYLAVVVLEKLSRSGEYVLNVVQLRNLFCLRSP